MTALGCSWTALPPEASTWRDMPGAAHRIGGTTAAAMLGVCPPTWTDASLWGVWARAHGLRRDATRHLDPVLERGHLLEPTILDLYRQRHPGGRSVRVRLTLFDDAAPWRVASPDALLSEDSTAWGVDAKSAGSYGARDDWPEDGAEIRSWPAAEPYPMPIQCAVQGYWYLSVMTAAPWWDFAVLMPSRSRDAVIHAAAVAVLGSTPASGHALIDRWHGRAEVIPDAAELRVVRLHRDEATQNMIVRRVTYLRQRHLVEGVEPDPDATDACAAELIGRLRTSTRPEYREATPAEERAARAYAASKAARERAEAEERAARGVLLHAGQTARRLTVGDTGRVSIARNGRITVKLED